MRRFGALTLAAAAALMLVAPTGAWSAEGFVTFRDHEENIIEHHSSPEGCYNVPADGRAEAAFARGTAVLFDRPDCEGVERTELRREPIRVLPHESVLIREN